MWKEFNDHWHHFIDTILSDNQSNVVTSKLVLKIDFQLQLDPSHWIEPIQYKFDLPYSAKFWRGEILTFLTLSS